MFSNRFKRLSPYVPGEQPQDRTYNKLNTNENPFPPSPKIKGFLSEMAIDPLRRYPDPSSTQLCDAIATHLKVQPNQVFVGNGSDEVLSFIFFAFFDSIRAPLFFPFHTYSFYPVYCDFYGIRYERISMEGDFSINLKGFLDKGPSSGMIVANPNAPTGIAIPLSAIDTFLSSYPKDNVVAIDEAYIDFGGESAIPLIEKYKNLIIIRTFSKSMSLAGIRLGYAIGDESLIRGLYAVKDSFNSYPVNAMTQKIGTLALNDWGYYQKMIQRVVFLRDDFSASLKQLGWNVLPSSANFVFAGKKGITGKSVYQTLKAKGILVRYFDTDGLKDFVRITIGDEGQMKQLIDEIKHCF